MVLCRSWFLLLVVSISALPQVAAERVIAAQPSIRVPDFRGKMLQQVEAAAVIPGTERRLFSKIGSQGVAGGVVVSQSPAANTPVIPGNTPLLVTLGNPPPTWVQTLVGAIGNAEKNTVEVPDVEGESRETAARAIEAARLRAEFTGDATGTVAQQSPAAGSRVAAGTTVTMTMALPLVVVPNLFGQTLAQATQSLAGESLQLGDVSGPNGDGSTVAQQSPLAGTHVAQGSYIAIELTAPAVTTGSTTTPPPPPQQVVVPSLVKLSAKQAVARLAKVGLHAGDISGPGNGLVTDQSPAAGTVVDPGTSVALTLAVAPVQPGQQSSPGKGTGDNSSTTTTTSGIVRIVAIAGAGVAGIVLIIAVVKIVAGAGAGKIIPPAAQVYRVVPVKPSPKTTVRGVPAIRFKLTVREVEPAPPRVAGNQPAITRKRVL